MAETLTETEKNFNLSMISMADSIITIIRLVSLVVIIIIAAVAANTMSMTTRERIGEFAVLKTLGFGAGRVSALIFGESLVISMTGSFFGMFLVFPAARLFRQLLGAYFPAFVVSSQTVYLDLLAGLVVGTVAALVPAWRSAHIRIAEGLRRIG